MNNERIPGGEVGRTVVKGIEGHREFLRATSERLSFIANGMGVKFPNLNGAVALLRDVNEMIHNQIEDTEDLPTTARELAAIAEGQAPFLPRTRYEQEAVEALKRAQAAEPDFHFATLPLTEVMCRAVVIAEKAFKERCKSVLVSDDDVAAVVEGVDPCDAVDPAPTQEHVQEDAPGT